MKLITEETRQQLIDYDYNCLLERFKTCDKSQYCNFCKFARRFVHGKLSNVCYQSDLLLLSYSSQVLVMSRYPVLQLLLEDDRTRFKLLKQLKARLKEDA